MLSPPRDTKDHGLLRFFRANKPYSRSTDRTPKTTNPSYEIPPTPLQGPRQNFPNQALTIHPEVTATPNQAVISINHTSGASQPNITLARNKSGSTVSRASVARVSTIIREANKIRPNKAPEYSQVKDTDREFWSLILSPSEYAYLLERVHKDQDLGDYFDKELRYEYSTLTNEFTILMSVTPLHGAFADQFKDLLAEIRSDIRRGIEGYQATPESLKKAAAKIKALGDARIYFEGVLNRKQPDGSYYSEDCEQTQPSFTLEVNWSRYNSDQLAERAQELITLSHGKIRTVLNVDLNKIYKASNEGKSLSQNADGPAAATISVWRAHTRDINGHQVTVPKRDYHESFRDAHGKVVDSTKLTLSLSDFICKEYATTLLGCDEVVIEVTAKQLCSIYEAAVRRQIKENQTNSARAAASSEVAAHEDNVNPEAAREEDVHDDAAREEEVRAVAPEPENRSPARTMKKKIGQILRRSERLANRNAA